LSSIDSAYAGLDRLLDRPVDRAIALACFALAAAVGLVGAFVGLETHGLWFDELFTARILAPAHGTTLLGRIAEDVHPPLYLLLLAAQSALFGAGDAALRAFSAACAVGAILAFVAGARPFSLAGRLFGAALATGSLFFFFQAQNARSYALCLLIGAAILVLSLRLLEPGPRARLQFAGLVALMALGSFVHFYMLYESLAVLSVIVLLRRDLRLAAIGAGAALALAVALYVRLVVVPFSQVSLAENWYPSHAGWYLDVLKSSVQYTWGTAGLAALALCLVVALHNGHWRRGNWRWRAGKTRPSPVTLLLLAVPLLVLAAAIVSSTLVAPNFYDRNFLVVSPFLWALAAQLYDAATGGASRPLRAGLNLALAALVVPTASIAALRLHGPALPLYEPFRESATWIRTLPQCRTAVLPVISSDRPAWYKAGYAATVYESGHGRYLSGFGRPHLLFLEDVEAHRLVPTLAEELRQRIDGSGCPVLVWTAHNMGPQTTARAVEALLQTIGRPASAVTIQEFRDGLPGFVASVTR
jgi:hypothetical protein